MKLDENSMKMSEELDDLVKENLKTKTTVAPGKIEKVLDATTKSVKTWIIPSVTGSKKNSGLPSRGLPSRTTYVQLQEGIHLSDYSLI